MAPLNVSAVLRAGLLWRRVRCCGWTTLRLATWPLLRQNVAFFWDERKPYACRHDVLADDDDLSSARDPLVVFEDWFNQALEKYGGLDDPLEANAVALATVGSNNQPNCRMVLLKGYGPDGYRFFTNYNSQKAREMDMNPAACLLFYWPALHRQIRIQGKVKKLQSEASDQYWKTRPVPSQASASISDQSHVVPSREFLEKKAAELQKKHNATGEAIPRPSNWGGYVLEPIRYEFWQGQSDRLHDRFQFRKAETTDTDYKPCSGEKNGVAKHGWICERLAP